MNNSTGKCWTLESVKVFQKFEDDFDSLTKEDFILLKRYEKEHMIFIERRHKNES
jgi:hypothetical protein|tara:strand:- start:2299 stop:2463 length:165 start_codon:yes stop_codon:yes gene_type:complete